jgi:thiosulfate dehydrogenase
MGVLMNKNMRAALFLFSAPLTLHMGPASAAGDIERGKTIAAQGNGAGALACATCHGADGKGNGAAGFPHIAGLNAGYLEKQLHDYASGARENAVMKPFASALSSDDITAVAAYYQNLGAPVSDTSRQTQTPDPANQGEWLAMRGDWDNNIPACNQCHGPDGTGVGDAFPALAGQHASYLKTQLLAWRNGSRTNDPDQLMKGISDRLNEQQIDAVTNYYANLPERLAAQADKKESRQ